MALQKKGINCSYYITDLCILYWYMGLLKLSPVVRYLSKFFFRINYLWKMCCLFYNFQVLYCLHLFHITTLLITTLRSSHQKCSPATVLKKEHWRRCFPVNIVKYLRTPALQNTSGRLLLGSFNTSNSKHRNFRSLLSRKVLFVKGKNKETVKK